MKQGKPVQSSHLAARFYKNAGWLREHLEPYLIKGKITDTEETHGDPPERAYFILETGSALDMTRLYRDHISTVGRWYEGPKKEEDLEYLKKLNW